MYVHRVDFTKVKKSLRLMKNNLTNRFERIYFIYKIYLMELSETAIQEELASKEWSLTEDEKNTIIEIVVKREELETAIKANILEPLRWERFNTMERAILLNGAAEILLFGNIKKVVINESIEHAKRYADFNSKKLINALLDKIK